MRVRHVWLAIWLSCLGCHSFIALDREAELPEAERYWRQGQSALRQGQAVQAVAFFEQSLQSDPKQTRNHLSLAAAFLEAGDGVKACDQLSQYMANHPDHWQVRGHFAELLLKQKDILEAREQFERFIAQVQEQGPDGRDHLIHAHTRLFEIAEQIEDDYGFHLHRGIGLYWLGVTRADLGAADDDSSPEGLLCKAAGELAHARLLKPAEARPCWYLHAAWSKLAQSQPAQRWLAAAERAAPFSYLTPAEQRDLLLAKTQCLDKTTVAARR